MSQNGWDEHRIHILDTLDFLREDVKEIKEMVYDIKTRTSVLEVKASVWGFLAGVIPAIGVILYNWLK